MVGHQFEPYPYRHAGPGGALVVPAWVVVIKAAAIVQTSESED